MKTEWTVLSLTQPWATLVMLGKKQQETRSWKTDYRGRLYIHASKGFPKSAQELCFTWPFNEYINPNTKSLPLGMILGSVELWKIESSEAALSAIQESETEGMQEEYRFGDYSQNRFVWYFRNVEVLDKPVPARGSLSLWKYTPGAKSHEL